jgi:molybdate transport system substrate-binding protein
MRRLAWASVLLAVAAPLAGCGSERAAGVKTVTIAAAASLRHVMPVLMDAHAKANPGVAYRGSYAASGVLRQQVEAGAPVDLAFFVGTADMDKLAAAKLVVEESRRTIARNVVVLIGHTGAAPATFQTLSDLPVRERIAIGDPASVPAGKYAKEALTTLGTWEALEKAGRFLLAADVAQVLAWVSRGETAVGVAYETEVGRAENVVVLDRALGDWAPKPELQGAVVTGTRLRAEAQHFLDYVMSDDGQKALADAGFLTTQS